VLQRLDDTGARADTLCAPSQRWQAASRELETQTATLRRSNTVRAGSVPPVSPNRSAMPMAMHR